MYVVTYSDSCGIGKSEISKMAFRVSCGTWVSCVMMKIVGQDDLAISRSGRPRSFLTFWVRTTSQFLNIFQDDLWDAMEEYKEAKEMMLDIGRQILLKVSIL